MKSRAFCAAHLQDGISQIEDLDAEVDAKEAVAIETRPKQTAVGCQGVFGSPTTVVSRRTSC